MIAGFLVWIVFGFAVTMFLSIFADFVRMIWPRRNRRRKQTQSKYIDNDFIRRA
jgi:hypothetical protein